MTTTTADIYTTTSYWNTTTESANGTCDLDGDKDKLHNLFGIKIIFGLLYCTVFLLAVGGNLLVIYVVLSNRSMQSVTNLFVTSLAVSDLAVNFTSLWLTPLYTYLGQWVWGVALCYAMPLFQGATIFISSFTLTAIAVDRYVVIVYPFKPRMSRKVCLLVILFIWTISLLLLLPYAIHMKLILHDEVCDIYICREDYTIPNTRVVLGIVVMTLQFAVPFLVIVFCYTLIWFNLQYRSTSLGQRSEAELLRKRRMLKMLISMVVIYALCWIPTNTMNILHDAFGGEIGYSNSFVFLYLLAHCISMSATMWNPFLYAFMNDSFRREFRLVLNRCCFGKNQKNKNYSAQKSSCTVSRGETRNYSVATDSRMSIRFSLLPPSDNASPVPSSKPTKKDIKEETVLPNSYINNNTTTTETKTNLDSSEEVEFLL